MSEIDYALQVLKQARQITARPMVSMDEATANYRTRLVQSQLRQARDRGWATEQEFAGPFGRNAGLNGWSRDRYKQMWDQVRAYAAAHNIDKIPQNRIGVLLGGGSGTGKTWTRNQISLPQVGPVSDENFGIVDPDEMKRWGWEHGMYDHLPGRFNNSLAPGEMADLVHEESSDMAKMYAMLLYRHGSNVVLDNTLVGDPAKRPVEKRLDALEKRGYTPHIVGLDAPPELSHSSATHRYNNNVRDWLARGGWSNPNAMGAGIDARLVNENYLLEAGRSPHPDYQHSATYNMVQSAPRVRQLGGTVNIIPAQVKPPGYTPKPYQPPPGLYSDPDSLGLSS